MPEMIINQAGHVNAELMETRRGNLDKRQPGDNVIGRMIDYGTGTGELLNFVAGDVALVRRAPYSMNSAMMKHTEMPVSVVVGLNGLLVPPDVRDLNELYVPFGLCNQDRTPTDATSTIQIAVAGKMPYNPRDLTNKPAGALLRCRMPSTNEAVRNFERLQEPACAEHKPDRFVAFLEAMHPCEITELPTLALTEALAPDASPLYSDLKLLTHGDNHYRASEVDTTHELVLRLRQFVYAIGVLFAGATLAGAGNPTADQVKEINDALYDRIFAGTVASTRDAAVNDIINRFDAARLQELFGFAVSGMLGTEALQEQYDPSKLFNGEPSATSPALGMSAFSLFDSAQLLRTRATWSSNRPAIMRESAGRLHEALAISYDFLLSQVVAKQMTQGPAGEQLTQLALLQ
jgi:hypothetical protein